MSTTAALVILAVAAALVWGGVVVAIVIRGRRTLERRLDSGLVAIGERMDTLARELATTVERSTEDALRVRLVESLAQTLDLDEVLARCVEAAASLHGVAAATAAVDIDGASFTASAGLAVAALGRADAGAIGGPPDGRRVRAVGISYHYPAGGAENDLVVVRSAIAVPLASEQGHLGFLTVFGRSEEPPVTGDDFLTLEAIVRHAGPAIDSACQRGQARPQTDVDQLTGLGSRQALHETLALEVARAHRHGRRLAACAFDIDDFRTTNARVGNLEGDGILVAVAELLRDNLRPGDLAYRSGGDEFAVILPDAGRIEGEALYARLQATLRRSSAFPTSDVNLSAGIAELKADDDGVSLFERSERALQRAKQAGKGTAA
jgi:diguanylate cyclase (GGDEF)-like protein